MKLSSLLPNAPLAQFLPKTGAEHLRLTTEEWPSRASPTSADTPSTSAASPTCRGPDAVFRTIIVGHDGTPAADVALRFAAQVAADGATLLLTRIVPADRVLARVLAHGREPSRGETAASELEALCSGVGGRLQVAARVLTGPSLERGLAAIAEEEGADLIVVGSDRRPGDFRASTVLGLRLLLRAPCAVAIAPADADFELHHIGVAYDGSPEAERALEAAYGVAQRLHAACTLFLAVLPGDLDPLNAQLAHREAAVLLDAAAERAPEGVDPETVIVPGFPSTAIARRVAGVIDLLVVGSRRQGSLTRALVGSTSRAIGLDVDCALLVTPTTSGAVAPAATRDG